jgi:hypothetical protein
VFFSSFDTEALNKQLLPDVLNELEDYTDRFNHIAHKKVNYGLQQLYTIGKDTCCVKLSI